MKITERDEIKVLLALLAYEMFNREIKIDASTVNWTAVLDEANRHRVTALLYPAVRSLNGVPDEILDKLCCIAITTAAASETMLKKQQDILNLLEAHQIPCAILKGTSVACCYPHPELRTIGDIDILIDEECIEHATECLNEAGFVLEHDTKVHLSFFGQGVEVELHRAISEFPELPKGTYTASLMVDALKHLHCEGVSNINFRCLDFQYQMVSLLAHIERHMQNSGIGLRQICDWAMTIDVHRADIGAKELCMLEQCGLLYFAKVVTSMCEKYLGLSPCSWTSNVPDDLKDALLTDLLKSGNFHVQKGERRFTTYLVDVYGGKEKENTFWNYVLYTQKRIRKEHPWAKNKFWILIFGIFWPARWGVRVLLGKRKKVNLIQAVSTARERGKLLREMKLYQ